MLISRPRATGVFPEGSYDYVSERKTRGKEEPPELRGVVFRQDPDGSSQILRYSGETTPDGPDIPDDLVVDNEVLIYVDGIGQRLREHRRQIAALLHGGQDTAANLDKPVLGVHQGAGKSTLADVARIGRTIFYTKALQSGLFSNDWVKRNAFKNDPAVQSVYNLVKQSLAAGVQVTLMAHSGGAAETAMALTLLSREDGGRLKDQISEEVRVLSLAGAASARDFFEAGVTEENLLYSGSLKDPVFAGFRHHIHPYRFWANLKPGVFAGLAALGSGSQISLFHSVDYIFQEHQTPTRHRLEDFLNGGPGGRFDLEFQG